VDFGPEEGLIGGDANNAKGFWEQREIHYLNHDVLTAIGGEYAIPPDLEEGWERSPDLDPLRRRIATVLELLFGETPQFGIKDPIMSITLPLWRDFVPDCRPVICVRHPAEMAGSFARFAERGALDGRTWPAVWSWTDLWFHYVANALVNTGGCRRNLVFFDRYFEDLDRQLEQLSSIAGRRLTRAARSSIAEFLDRDLRHERHDKHGDSGMSTVMSEAQALYSALRAAGPDATDRQIDQVEEIARELLADRARRAPFDGPDERARPQLATVPSSISVFPDDLAGARYYGVWSDGWLGREASLALAAGPAATLRMRALVPEAEGQSVTVAIDGAVVDSVTADPGILDLSVPISASMEPRRVVLRWAKTVPLSQPDWRSVAALLELLAVESGSS
jgi:hypothetical protein